MTDIVNKRGKRVTLRWKNWGRTYRVRLNVEKSSETIRILKGATEMKTLMECMTPIYQAWERNHDMGEHGVYKPSDLINHYGIKEV